MHIEKFQNILKFKITDEEVVLLLQVVHSEAQVYPVAIFLQKAFTGCMDLMGLLTETMNKNQTTYPAFFYLNWPLTLIIYENITNRI